MGRGDSCAGAAPEALRLLLRATPPPHPRSAPPPCESSGGLLVRLTEPASHAWCEDSRGSCRDSAGTQ